MSGNVTGIHVFTVATSFTAVTANNGSEQSVTVPGVIFGRDEVIRVFKKTHQAGLGQQGWVSADNTIKVRFTNCTTSDITPTASDVYTYTVERHDASLPAGDCNM